MTKTFEEVFAGMEPGAQEAIIRKVARAKGDESHCEEVLRGVLTGELRIVLVDGTLKFVDSHGRCIPFGGMQSEFVDPNYDFHLIRPELDYAARLARFHSVFQLASPIISEEEFRVRVMAIMERVRSDKQIANLVDGDRSIGLPLIIAQRSAGDYGQTLEEVFLVAAERSYTAQYGGKRKFVNHRRGQLAGQVQVVAGTRHEQLVATMERGVVVMVYFPIAFQGFSVPADREFIATMPQGCILSGGYDISTAMAMYPDVLMRNWYTPGLDMAALRWRSRECSLYCKAYGGEAFFDLRNLIADGSYSGGVSILG